MKKGKFGFGWIEILMIIVIIALPTVILWPIFVPHPDAARYTTCISNLRQSAMAVTMYSQDNKNRLPGLNDNKSKKYVGWAINVLAYIRGGTDVSDPIEMFYCPESKSKLKTPICYGYNALLLQPDGMGIEEKNILEPTKVGVLCDADPLQGEGGIIGNTTSMDSKASQLTVKPVGRHNGGVVVGYADGHASMVQEKYNENDPTNEVNRAFYRAVELGFIKKVTTGGR